VGKARVEKLGDITSDLAGDWPGDIAGARSRTFWVRELIE
jgi:hypothetical protein